VVTSSVGRHARVLVTDAALTQCGLTETIEIGQGNQLHLSFVIETLRALATCRIISSLRSSRRSPQPPTFSRDGERILSLEPRLGFPRSGDFFERSPLVSGRAPIRTRTIERTKRPTARIRRRMVPIMCSDHAARIGNMETARKPTLQMNIVVMATARGRIRLGKISDIINHGSGPSAEGLGDRAERHGCQHEPAGNTEMIDQPDQRGWPRPSPAN